MKNAVVCAVLGVLWVGFLPTAVVSQLPPSNFHIMYIEPNPGDPDLGEFPQAARVALDYAANQILAYEIHSPFPIHVVARWVIQETGFLPLASGSPAAVREVTASSPDVLFPLALADALEGRDFNPEGFDIEVSFYSRHDWYTGTDGLVGQGQYDLVTVALHELIHGLGFSSSVRFGASDSILPMCGDNFGCWGVSDDQHRVRPMPFEVFATTENGDSLLGLPNPSIELGEVIRASAFFTHGFVRSALEGRSARLWTPNAWDENSSFSHLDSSEFAHPNRDSLMVPALSPGVSQHQVGPVALSILEALGYRLRANDFFRNRYRLAGPSGVTVANNDKSSIEWHEPAHSADGTLGDKSIWWEWVAPASGSLTLFSQGGGPDTRIAVYKGRTLLDLLLVAVKDHSMDTEQLVLDVEGGVAHQIAFAALGESGDISLGWHFEPGTVDLALELSASPDPAKALSEFTYSAVISNSGPTSATKIDMSVSLDEGTEFVSSNPSGICEKSGAAVSCRLPDLAPGQSAGVRLLVVSARAGWVIGEARVTGSEEEANISDNLSTSRLWLDFPEACSSADVVTTIESTSVGGSWSNPSTWVGGRIPLETDQVALYGPVSLDRNAEIAGLYLSNAGVLQEGTPSPTLLIRGGLINSGAIRSGRSDWLFTVEVRGSVINEGQIGSSRNVQLKVSGCISNEGVWTGARTSLTGAESRFILGAMPIGGDVTITEGFELLASANLTADVSFALDSAALTIRSPYSLTIGSIAGGVLRGSGVVNVLGGQSGILTGDLSEIRFAGVGSGLIRGRIELPSIIFDGQGTQVLNATLQGMVTILPGAVLRDFGSSNSPWTLDVLGKLANNGKITVGGVHSQFRVTIHGDVDNVGVVDGGTLTIAVTGSIFNRGVWAPRWTELLGPEIVSIGPDPLAGDIDVRGKVEIVGSAVFLGTLYISSSEGLTVNAPSLVTAGGIGGGKLHGSGIVRIKGGQSGVVSGTLAEVRFGGGSGGVVQGTVDLPNIVFEPPGAQVTNGTLRGRVTVLSGSVLRSLGNNGQYSLLVYGDLINYGEVASGGGLATFHVAVNGSLENYGSVAGVGLLTIATTGNIANHGRWAPRWTELIGPGVYSIGPQPLAGDVNVRGAVEIISSVELTGTLNFLSTASSLAINAPRVVTVGGISWGQLHGSGIMRVLGEQSGLVSGTLAEFRLSSASGGLVKGTIDLPHIVVEGQSVQVFNAVMRGKVTILPGAVLGDVGNNGTYSLIVHGDLLNFGTVRSGGALGRFDVAVWGAVFNGGVIDGPMEIRIAGDLRNLGTWKASRGTFIQWPAIAGVSGYDLQISPNVETWPNAVLLTENRYNVSDLVDSTRFWRVRSASNDGASAWSRIIAINRASIMLRHPSGSATYRGGDYVDLAWISESVAATAPILLSMKRDSAVHLSSPDGANWIHLAENVSNDGSERLSIPAAASVGNDWRFYVRDVGTGVYDATDFTFPVVGQPELCSGEGSCFYTLTPCRLIDTRQNGQGPILLSGEIRTLIVEGVCNVPSTARAITANLTVVGGTGPGHITIFPGDSPIPLTSSINFSDARARANNAIIPLSSTGDLLMSPQVTGNGRAHLIVDVNGYFE